jgi:hypothetical protein
VHGFTLTCTALRAISAMPGIGISRHAAQLQLVILQTNGQRSLPRCCIGGRRPETRYIWRIIVCNALPPGVTAVPYLESTGP